VVRLSKVHKSIKEINEYLRFNTRNPTRIIEADRKENLTVRDLEELQKTTVYLRKLLERKTKLFYNGLM